MERQNISENNINIILAVLTTQLQQLIQLVANPFPPPIPNISPLPLASLPPALAMRQTRPKLSCPLDFSREHHNSCTFLNFCSFYIYLALEQFHDKEERILWALTFFKGGCATKWSENVFH